MSFRFACVAWILLTCASCNQLVFPHAAPVKSVWRTAVVFDSSIPVETQENITKELNQLYVNSRTTNAKFAPAKDTADADMVISVSCYESVSRDKQIEGAFVSLVGFTVPPILSAVAELPVTFVFWYFPKSHSTVRMYVHDGDNNAHVRRKSYVIQGPGFLKKQSTQARLHSKGYRKYFRHVLRYYNKELRQAS